jgi:uncharacterized protein
MDYVLGFVIAVVITLTGVGAGTATVPLLILFLHLPVDVAVSTALVYSSIVKIIAVPVQIVRRQIDYRVLGCMLIGGLPGVVLGSILFKQATTHFGRSPLYFLLGIIIILSSAWGIFRHFRRTKINRASRWHPKWLVATSVFIGTEVGFSSSGAGALGTVALLGMTDLPTSRVVGTDLAFGLAISLVGSGFHTSFHSGASPMIIRMDVGGVLGAILGACAGPKIPTRNLRLALSVWLVVIGVDLCCHAFTK